MNNQLLDQPFALGYSLSVADTAEPYAGCGWATLVGGLMLTIAVATLVQKIFYPMEYAATSLNRSITSCSETIAAKSQDIDYVVYHLVKCNIISTEEADRFRQLYKENKLHWSAQKERWVSSETISEEQRRSDWLRKLEPSPSASARP